MATESRLLPLGGVMLVEPVHGCLRGLVGQGAFVRDHAWESQLLCG